MVLSSSFLLQVVVKSANAAISQNSEVDLGT